MDASSGWSLICVEGQLDPSEFEITEAGITFGRGEFNSVVLNSGNVSRKHARVFLFEGVPYVQDMGSRNGIFVNGERIPEQSSLTPADRMSMGEFTFQVRGVGGASAASGGPPKKMIIIAAAAILGIAVIGGVVSMMGGSGGSETTTVSAPDGAANPPQGNDAANLFNFEDPPPVAKEPQGGQPAPDNRKIDVASTSLTGAEGQAQITAEQRNKLVKEYLERGLLSQQQGDLQEAKAYYGRSVQLDPGCALCRSRLERIDAEIKETTQKHFDAALRYYNGMRYEEAIANWELVLNLQNDKNSELYQKSTGYITEARRKLEASRQY